MNGRENTMNQPYLDPSISSDDAGGISPEQALEREVDAMLAAGALSGTAAQFAQPRGADMLARPAAVEGWHDQRAAHQLWQYSRSLEGAPYPIASIRDEAGTGARRPRLRPDARPATGSPGRRN